MTRPLLLFVTLFVSTVSAQVVERGPTPRLCDHYGDPLPEGAIRRFGTVRFFHPEMTGYAITEEGRTIVTVGDDGYVRWWNVATGKEVRASRLAKTEWLSPPVISADGRTAVVHVDQRLLIYDLQTNPPTKKYDEPYRDSVRSLSPDGTTIIHYVEHAQSLQAWKWATKRERRLDTPMDSETPFGFGFGSGRGVAKPTFAGNGQVVAKLHSLKNQPLIISDVTTGRIRMALDYLPSSMALSHDGNWFVLGGGEYRADVLHTKLYGYDVATKKRSWELPLRSNSWCNALAISPDTRFIAFSSEDDGGLYDMKNQRVHCRLPGNVRSFRFTADGQMLFADGHNCFQSWNVATGKPLLLEVPSVAQVLRATPAQGQLVVCITPNRFDWWNLATGEWLQETVLADREQQDRDDPKAMFLRGDTLSSVQNQTLYTLARGQKKQQAVPLEWPTRLPDRYLNSAVYAANGQQIFGVVPVGNADDIRDEWCRWDTTTGKTVTRRTLRRESRKIHSITTDLALAAVEGNNTTDLIEVATGAIRATLPVFGPTAFAPDGSLLAVWQDIREKERYDGELTLWDTLTGKRLHLIRTHHELLPSMWFTSDARQLVFIEGSAIRVFDCVTGRNVGTLPIPLPKRWRDRTPINGGVLLNDHELMTFHWDRHPALVWDLRRFRPTLTSETLGVRQCEEHFTNLAADDVAKALTGQEALSRMPERDLLVFLKQHLPAPTTTPEAVGALVSELNAVAFAKREAATEKLVALGRPTLTLLLEAQRTTTAEEVRERLGKVVERINQAPQTPTERQVVRALALLERSGTKEAKALLRDLAKGSELAHITHAAKAALARVGDGAK